MVLNGTANSFIFSMGGERSSQESATQEVRAVVKFSAQVGTGNLYCNSLLPSSRSHNVDPFA